jgi:hypothetical protein
MTALEKENVALRQELSRRTACAHECPRCRGSASESDRPTREGKSEKARFADLESRVEEIRPSILRAIEERFGDHLLNKPETRQRMTEHPATSLSPSLPRNHHHLPRGNRRRKSGKRRLPKGREGRRPRRGWQVTSGKRRRRGKDCGPNTTGEAAANAATPGKDDGTTQTEASRMATPPAYSERLR